MGLDSLRLSAEQRAFLEKATATYENQVGSETVSYLIGRGLDQAAATSFRLGYVNEPLSGHETMQGRLCIPYLTPSGVVALKFRTIADDKVKFLGMPGAQGRLFNTRDLFVGGNTIVLCEGEPDAIVCSAMVGVPAVGVPGASALERHWPRCFADYERVVICFDNDVKDDGSNPGLSAAKKWAGLLQEARIVSPPAGLDLNEWYLRDGREVVRERLLG